MIAPNSAIKFYLTWQIGLNQSQCNKKLSRIYVPMIGWGVQNTSCWISLTKGKNWLHHHFHRLNVVWGRPVSHICFCRGANLNLSVCRISKKLPLLLETFQHYLYVSSSSTSPLHFCDGHQGCSLGNLDLSPPKRDPPSLLAPNTLYNATWRQ